MEPSPPPTIEIDLSAVHDRLNSLDQMITSLSKLIVENEEIALYVINKRPGSGEITKSIHSPTLPKGQSIQFIYNCQKLDNWILSTLGDKQHNQDEQIHDQMIKLQTLVRNIQNEDLINNSITSVDIALSIV